MLLEEKISLILKEEEAKNLKNDLGKSEKSINVIEDIGADILDSISSELESLETSDENMQEAAGVIIAGLSAALPIVLKGLGKLSNLAGKALSKLPGADAYDYESMGEEWKAWWYEKSKELHHAYIGAVERLVSIMYRIITRGKGKLDPAKKHKLAEGIWTVVVAYLMVASGAGVLKAAASHSYGVAGLESALTAVKAEEVGAFLISLFVRTVGDVDIEV